MRSLCLAALFALAGCTFDAETSDINVNVTNISQNQPVDRLIVTLTLPDGPHPFQPSFQPTSNQTIDLTFDSGGQIGSFTILVDQQDRNATSYGTVSCTGPLPQTTCKTVALPSTP